MPKKIEIKISCFTTWSKWSGQKSKHLSNKKSFQDEIKNIFHHLYRTFIQVNKTTL